MTVRKKASLIIALILLTLTLVIIVLAGVGLYHTARKNERQQAMKETQRALLALSNEMREQELLSDSYANWDETCVFIHDHNQTFIKANLSDGHFVKNRFSFLALIDQNGQVVFIKCFDLGQNRPIPVPESLRQLIRSDPFLTRHPDITTNIAGVWSTPEGPIILVSYPILNSLHQGPSRGTLIIGRRLDDSELAYLASQAQVKILLLPLADPRLPPGIIPELQAATEAQPIAIFVPNREVIYGYGLVRDGHGRPALIARVEYERILSQQAWHALGFLLAALLLVGAGAIAATLVLLDRIVLKRLSKLHQFVEDVSTGQQLSSRLELAGCDELSQLGDTFNDLLGQLENHLQEQQRAEDALHRSMNEWERTFNAMSDWVSLVGLDSRILRSNSACERIIGKPVIDIIGQQCCSLIHGSGDGPVDCPLKKMLQSRQREILEIHQPVRQRWLSVSVEPVTDSSGNIICAVHIVSDITGRKLSDEALRESERRFKEMLENVNLVAVMLDRQGRLTFCNEYLTTITGWTKEEILGQDWFELFIPESERAEFRVLFLEEVKNQRIFIHHENTILTRGGELRQIEWDNTVLRDLEGRVTGTASMGRDVTDFRQLEAQYRQAQKMEVVGQLAGGITHDFNNLLQVMSGYVELAMLDLNPSDPVCNNMQEVLKATTRAKALIRQLLSFSRRDTKKYEPLYLDRVVNDTAEMLRRVIGEHIELETFSRGTIPPINSDPTQIEQILMNLCVNARDAMPSGGTIRIETSPAEIDRQIAKQYPWVNEGQYIQLEVADTGLGISSEILEHIFEPFFTTKEAGKGSGLGLATVYAIVRQHGGFINVSSQSGQGTVFRIHFPIAAESQADKALADTHPLEKPAPGHGETILVAEDDEAVRTFTTQVLRGAGYQVLVARDGEEAIQIFTQRGPQIDLFILDVIMPRKSGRAVYDAIIARNPGVKVLFTSGYSFGMLESGYLPAGGFELLQKPFSPSALLSKVHPLIEKK